MQSVLSLLAHCRQRCCHHFGEFRDCNKQTINAGLVCRTCLSWKFGLKGGVANVLLHDCPTCSAEMGRLTLERRGGSASLRSAGVVLNGLWLVKIVYDGQTTRFACCSIPLSAT